MLYGWASYPLAIHHSCCCSAAMIACTSHIAATSMGVCMAGPPYRLVVACTPMYPLVAPWPGGQWVRWAWDGGGVQFEGDTEAQVR